MTDSTLDNHWMEYALNLAQQAQKLDEVPVGAVLIQDDQLVGEGYNQPIKSQDPTAHAEIQAMRQGAKTLQNYRLLNTTLYVTLEPCTMCASAIFHARIKRLVYGATDPKAGSDSVFDLLRSPLFNHKIDITTGVMENECSTLLTTFFQERRQGLR